MKVLDGRWAPWLLGSFLVVGLAWPALDPAVQLFYRDTGRLYYELKLFIAAQLTQGQSPFWDPWVESGTPILTQVAPGLFHPLTLLYLAPFDLAFKLNHLLALPLAFASMVLLCRKTGASRWAAAAAAAAYAGSGWVVSMTNCNLTYALSAGAIPLALHGLLRFVERPRPLRLLWASYALALCFYGGDPQSMLFAGALGAAWVLGAKRSWRSLAEVAAWGFCAILLAAPAVLPVLPRLLQSSRSSGLSEQELATFAQCQAGGTIAAAPVQLFRGPVPLADALRALAGPSTERWRTRAATPGSLLIDGFPTRMRPWIGGQQMLDPMFNQLAAVESVASYTPLADLDYETAYLFAPSALSQTMGVRFDIQGPTEMAPEAAARNGYRRRGPYGAWVKEFPARPRAFLAARARTAVSRDEALHLLSHGAFQVREAVLRKEVQLPCPAAPAPAVDLERHAPDSLRATFVASARSVLVVSEHYDSGWRATLDGAPAEVLQANLSALAVVVPAGAHAVELRYQPPWLLPGLLLALACALALGLLEFLEKDHRVGAAEAE